MTPDIFLDVMHIFFPFFVLSVASAPQQESEAESTADLPNKGLGQTSSGPSSLVVQGPACLSDKDCDTEKSTDAAPVTLS